MGIEKSQVHIAHSDSKETRHLEFEKQEDNASKAVVTLYQW